MSDGSLEVGQTYYSVIVAVNELVVEQSERSDGVTVVDLSVDPDSAVVTPGSSSVVPGSVKDGTKEGVDVSVQLSMYTLSATWDGFHTCANEAGKIHMLLSRILTNSTCYIYIVCNIKAEQLRRC